MAAKLAPNCLCSAVGSQWKANQKFASASDLETPDPAGCFWPGGKQDRAPRVGGEPVWPLVCAGLGQGWDGTGKMRVALRDRVPGLAVGQGSDGGGGAEGTAPAPGGQR